MIEHQQSHAYQSSIFLVKQQAFNQTTLVYRKELDGSEFAVFDSLLSEEYEKEIGKIIASEIVQKHAMIFSIAVSAYFTKFGIDGAVETRVSPCFFLKPSIY